MMELPLYQVDAFTDRRFSGNPAAVVPLRAWLDDELLAAIALENNLSETAFFVPEGDGFRLRWFTPACEVKLCGHATLATAFVLMTLIEPERSEVAFETRSGRLTVTKLGDLFVLDFPRRDATPLPAPAGLEQALGAPFREVHATDEATLVLLADEATVANLRPDLRFIEVQTGRALMVTAPGDEEDFVSRFFAPGEGIDEDPVTGSAHCTLAPFWASRLGKCELRARQVSARGGELECVVGDDRVLLKGRAVLTLKGTLFV